MPGAVTKLASLSRDRGADNELSRRPPRLELPYSVEYTTIYVLSAGLENPFFSNFECFGVGRLTLVYCRIIFLSPMVNKTFNHQPRTESPFPPYRLYKFIE